MISISTAINALKSFGSAVVETFFMLSEDEDTLTTEDGDNIELDL